MSNEQFVFWLKGFLEGKDDLREPSTLMIKEKLSSVYTYSTMHNTIMGPFSQPIWTSTASTSDANL
jgi:hypothetical protein